MSELIERMAIELAEDDGRCWELLDNLPPDDPTKTAANIWKANYRIKARKVLAMLAKPENITDESCKAFYELIAPTGIGTSGTAYMLASAHTNGEVQPWEMWRQHSGGFFAQELRKAIAAAISSILNESVGET